MDSASASNNTNNTKPKRPPPNKPITKDHNLRKRRPQKPEQSDSIIYVSTKTNINALLDKCTKLINAGENEITVYCLGAAIQRGILLALKITEKHVAYNARTNTFTTELIDDLEPAADDADYAIQRRFNSALKIVLTRRDPLD